jgi:predicted dehydrogenase
MGFPEVEVVAVSDVDTTRRSAAQKRVNDYYTKQSASDAAHKACDAYSDFREIIARKDIDAVCIATPDHWHAIITIAALDSGKDVYCEKPLTHTIHEAIAVKAAVERNKRVLQTGSMQRSSNEFRVASELVRNGVIGKVKTVDTSFGSPAKPNANPEEAMEPGLDWEMWCGPAKLSPYSSVLSPRGIHNHFPQWRMTREYGGGMVCDWGAHHIDIAQWGLGMDGNGPVEVRAAANAETAKNGCQLVYADGVVLNHVDGRGASFFGEDGEVHVNRGKFEVILKGESKYKFWDKEADKKTTLAREVTFAERDLLKDAKIHLYKSSNQLADFIKCIGTREKPICSEIVGAGSAIACHLMNVSYYHNASFKWDPIKNQIVSGAEPAWLTKEYRGAWKV